ncbi:MAG: hypothetical protein RH949_23310 [Coleofasciculus sp. A1-SPW-01]|uniref:hypothetical protein n=1 Tax=Coleofasciculus TaxID=669368 RepID=UPI0012FBDB10|nr:hypothetical protein [Coleofasciculus chthonoplastes]
MNRLFNTQLIVALAGASLSFLAGVEPGIAQPDQYCDDPGSIPAAQTTRNLELDRFGIELTIPSNFRAIRLNNGNVISKSCDCSGMSESLVSLLERSSLLQPSQASTP